MTTSTRFRSYLNPTNTAVLRLALVSEGFTQRDDFDAAAETFFDLLDGASPFNDLQFKPGGLSVAVEFVGGGQGPTLDATPAQSYFGFSLNTATGVLSPPDSDHLPNRIFSTGAGDFDVCALLLPDQVNGRPISGVFYRSYDAGNLQPQIVLATTVDGGWPQLVLLALGEFLGLGPEDDGVNAATDDQALRAELKYPNVVVIPDLAQSPFVPDSNFKWWPELNATQRRGLRVFPSGTPQNRSGDLGEIALFEGAAGYSKGVYRSAADCIMRWPNMSSLAAASLKTQEVMFCPICERTIRRLVGRSESFAGDRNLHRQALTFDQVSGWQPGPTVYTGSQIPPQIEVQIIPNVSGEQWGFLAQFGPAQRGMIVKQLRYTGYPNALAGIHPDSAPDVMELVEFRDVAVRVNDGNADVIADFDYTEAFTSAAVPPPVLIVARNGSLANSPTPVLHGLKLTLYSTCGGRAEVRLELSLSLKATAADFDPGGAVFGARFYPQMALTWKANFGKTVHDMRGCIRMIFNNHEVETPGGAGQMMMGQGGDGMPAADPRSVANLFSDTNSSLNAQRRGVPKIPTKDIVQGFPGNAWAVVFDFFKPDINEETEFVGVYGPSSPQYGSEREGEWDAPDGNPAKKYTITKRPRQGLYDNIHMHWNMGPDPRNPNVVMVHAPGCGEACVHIHWRWGFLAGTGSLRNMATVFDALGPSGLGIGRSVLGSLIPNPPEMFRGWNKSEPFAEVGWPLIPPNQELEVAILHPDTVRSAAFNRVLDSNVPRKKLDGRRKAIWYTASIVGPTEGERQVIFEQGGDFAHTYHLDAGLLFVTKIWYRLQLGIPLDAPLSEVAKLLHTDYSARRWMKKPDGSVVEQVPHGDVPSKSTPRTTPEEM